MVAFGFSVGDVIASVELCRKLLGALKTTTGAAATYQRTATELESLEKVLRQVELLEAFGHDDNHQCIDSLHAVALATMYPVRDFSQELQKYEAALFPSATSKTGRVKKIGRAMQWTMGIDEEVQKFQLYISGQLLSITTLFQLLERDIASAREARRMKEHETMTTLLMLQSSASARIGAQISTMNDGQVQQMQAIQKIARESIRNGQMLLQMQQNMLSMPSISPAETIALQDPLGRKFNLPYAYFQQWELVQNFIQHQFTVDKIPGSAQVQAGDFFISREGTNRALSKSNWKSNVYPGVALNMTVVFTMLRMQLRRCPRPGCDSPVSDVTVPTEFMTCLKCQLSFRFDPDMTALGLQPEEDKLRLAQQGHDLDSFGRRQEPADIVEILSVDGRENDMISDQEREVDILSDDEREVDSLSDDEREVESLSDDGSEADVRPKSISLKEDDVETRSSTLSFRSAVSHQGHTSSDHSRSLHELPGSGSTHAASRNDENTSSAEEQESGYTATSVAAWLEYSVIPTTPNTANQDPTSNEPPNYISRKQDELEALKSLNRVHFVQKVPETRPLQDTVETYSDMPLDAQIYLRKVVDRFPALPPYLAKRFANANVKRAQRLRAGKEAP